jgi:hypothetical protein
MWQRKFCFLKNVWDNSNYQEKVVKIKHYGTWTFKLLEDKPHEDDGIAKQCVIDVFRTT